MSVETEELLAEASKDAMRWLYRALEREHDDAMSDEQAAESIKANEYEFTADGKRQVTL